jgi:hypothetical protein
MVQADLHISGNLVLAFVTDLNRHVTPSKTAAALDETIHIASVDN